MKHSDDGAKNSKHSKRYIKTTLWANTDLPNLQCLEYATSQSASYLPALTNLAAPQRLTSLSLSIGTAFTVETFAECLGLLPNLENLLLHQKRRSLAGKGVIASSAATYCSSSHPPPTPPSCSPLVCKASPVSASTPAPISNCLSAFVEARRTLPSPLSRLHVAFPRAQQVVDIDAHIAATGMSATLWYPTRGNLNFMANPSQASFYSRRSEKPSTRQEHRDADWGPISTRWVAEYAEWAVTPKWVGDVDDIS
ncbi:hypothetical protein C8R46DRAFT_1209915 [Mycena filopes]|nr:hypothetical protein C8R46DRAFT_1209915 [Mycena filopes]